MAEWHDSLPDDLKVSPVLAKYEEPEQAYKALIELNSRLGRSVVIPNDDSDADEMQAYYDKLAKTTQGKLIPHPDTADGEHADEFWKLLGKPEEAKGYEAPEGISLDTEVVDNVRNMALEAGLTKKQFQAQIKLLDAESANQTQTFEQMKADDEAIVKTKFGLAEPQKKLAIDALVNKFQDPEHPLGELNSAAYLMLDKIVEAFSGRGPQVFNQPSGDNNLPTPSEAAEKFAQNVTKLSKHNINPIERKRLLQEQVMLSKARYQQ